MAHSPPSVRALEAGLAGLFFSLALSVVIALGLAVNAAPLKAVERTGIDWSLRLFSALYPDFNPEAQTAEVRYAFLDAGPDSCERFRGPKEAPCDVGNPIRPDMIIAFAQFARASGVAVAIIDTDLPEEDTARNRVLRELEAQSVDGPWFIIPARCRPADGEGLKERCEPALPPKGQVREASFLTATDVEARDGVLRHFPIATQVAGLPPGRRDWLPSAPYVAAHIAHPLDGPILDCAYYEQRCGKHVDRNVVLVPEHDQARLAQRNRIFFTLPSQPAQDEPQPGYDRYVPLMERYERFLAPAGKALQASRHFQGSTVLLGSSTATGLDWHVTPLGEMSGSEIILNATRGFREASTMTEPHADAPFEHRLQHYLKELPKKALGALAGAVAIWPLWWAIYAVLARASGRGAVAKGLARAAVAGLFIAALGVLLLVEVGLNLLELREGAKGEPVDMMTPLLALGLEGYAEVARLASSGFEKLAERALEVLTPFAASVSLRLRRAADLTWAYTKRLQRSWRVWRWRRRRRSRRASRASPARSSAPSPPAPPTSA